MRKIRSYITNARLSLFKLKPAQFCRYFFLVNVFKYVVCKMSSKKVAVILHLFVIFMILQIKPAFD